LETYLLGRKN